MRKYRLEGGPSPSSYLGSKWFFMKLVLVVLAYSVFTGAEQSHYLGWLIAGYLVGTTSASMKTLLSLRRLWPIQEAITDWSIVDEKLGK